MRYFLIVIFIAFLSHDSYGQGCGLISETKNNKTGIETKGGIVSSKDFYSLLINKTFDPNNADDSLNYVLIVHAASRVLLSDSLIQSTGNVELFLSNDQIVLLENANCLNNPMGISGSIGFTVKTTERQILKLTNHSLVKLRAFGILETEFSPNKQKQLLKIANCLINN